MRSGGERTFHPDKLPRNLKHDAVSVYGIKRIELHAGDRIRWTGTDHQRGLLNADLARAIGLPRYRSSNKDYKS